MTNYTKLITAAGVAILALTACDPDKGKVDSTEVEVTCQVEDEVNLDGVCIHIDELPRTPQECEDVAYEGATDEAVKRAHELCARLFPGEYYAGDDPGTPPEVKADEGVAPYIPPMTRPEDTVEVAPPPPAPKVEAPAPPPPPPAPLPEVIHEDDPRWDCLTMGNRTCGPNAPWWMKDGDPNTGPDSPMPGEGVTPAGVALSQVGMTGPYAEGGFWCAKFVGWVMQQAGVEGWVDTDSPLVAYYQALNAGQVKEGDPQVGDVVWVDLFNGTQPGNPVSHVGIVVEVHADRVVTVEGNTPASPNRVALLERQVDQEGVVGFTSF